jgi:outer membrane biosynthesis protein TonB
MNVLKRTNRHLAPAACLIALAAGALAVGCGSDDEGAPIPANIADQLQTRLDEIERRFEFGNGACADIDNDSKPAVEQLVASVPNDVDADVRQALSESFDRLFELTAEQCEQQQTETQPAPTPEPEPEPEPEPVPTEPAPPETTETEAPPQTETTPPPEQTETSPPPTQGQEGEGGEGGDGGEGGGSGAGQGGSGATGEGGSGGVLVPEDQG